MAMSLTIDGAQRGHAFISIIVIQAVFVEQKVVNTNEQYPFIILIFRIIVTHNHSLLYLSNNLKANKICHNDANLLPPLSFHCGDDLLVCLNGFHVVFPYLL